MDRPLLVLVDSASCLLLLVLSVCSPGAHPRRVLGQLADRCDASDVRLVQPDASLWLAGMMGIDISAAGRYRVHVRRISGGALSGFSLRISELKDNNIALAQRLAILEYQYKSTHEEQHPDSKTTVETASPSRRRRKPAWWHLGDRHCAGPVCGVRSVWPGSEWRVPVRRQLSAVSDAGRRRRAAWSRGLGSGHC